GMAYVIKSVPKSFVPFMGAVFESNMGIFARCIDVGVKIARKTHAFQMRNGRCDAAGGILEKQGGFFYIFLSCQNFLSIWVGFAPIMDNTPQINNKGIVTVTHVLEAG